MAKLVEFDTYRWQAEQVEQLLQDFIQYHASHRQSDNPYAVKVQSYAFTVAKQLFARHFAFILLQLIFLMVFIGVGVWYNL